MTDTSNAGGTTANPIFGVRCHKCGHVNYFDKRRVCPAGGTIMRDVVRLDGKDIDQLYLRCEACHEEITAEVDCEDYK